MTTLLLELAGTAVDGGLFLARHVEEHGLDRVGHGLAALPEREEADADGAAEKPQDAHDDPAWKAYQYQNPSQRIVQYWIIGCINIPVKNFLLKT